MQNDNYPKSNYDILWFIGLIIGVLMCLLLSGCQLPSLTPLHPTTSISPLQNLTEAVTKTNWIITISILGMALAVVAWMNGSKMAIGIMAGCGVAMWLQLTVVRYASILAWAGLVFALGIVLWTVFVKNRALKEIISGIQKYKKSKNVCTIREHLYQQCKTTKKLVSQIKKKEKPKEGCNII